LNSNAKSKLYKVIRKRLVLYYIKTENPTLELKRFLNFWSSTFSLSGACIKEIQQLCSAFLWSGADLNPSKAKISWDVVCLPIREGGLGLRPLKETNKVCGLKLIWRLFAAPTSLWSKWIHAYLIRKKTFWTVKGNSSQGS